MTHQFKKNDIVNIKGRIVEIYNSLAKVEFTSGEKELLHQSDLTLSEPEGEKCGTVGVCGGKCSGSYGSAGKVEGICYCEKAGLHSCWKESKEKIEEIDLSKIRGKWSENDGEYFVAGGDDTIKSIRMVAETVNQVINKLNQL